MATVNEAQRPRPTGTQWRGANRDGVVAAFTPPATWPETLTQRWKIDVGTGYATPLVVGNRVYVFSRQGDNEVDERPRRRQRARYCGSTGYPAPFR